MVLLFRSSKLELSLPNSFIEWFCYSDPHNLKCPLQDPAQADPMMKVQNELDETKIILHSTIEAVLQRGEKLDDLVTAFHN